MTPPRDLRQQPNGTLAEDPFDSPTQHEPRHHELQQELIEAETAGDTARVGQILALLARLNRPKKGK